MMRTTLACAAVLVLLLSAAASGASTQAAESIPSALADALAQGQRATALQLIAQGTDVNAAQPDGTTPLHWAVLAADGELVELLLSRKARPSPRNAFGSTPLLEAARLGDAALLDRLLKAGARGDEANDDGQTALMLAARTGQVPAAEALLHRGAKVNAHDQWRGQTALMWASAEGHVDMLRLLLKHGAAPDARAFINEWDTQVTTEPRAQYRPSAGLTPLLYAARGGCTPCVQALLEAGADVDKPTPDGVTALMVALDNFRFDTARALLRGGANPHLSDWWGRTALYVAIDMSSFPMRPAPVAGAPTALDIAADLLAAGVEVQPQLNFHRPGRGANSGRFTDDLLTVGATPLLRAAIGFDVPAIRLLLKHGAQVDLPNGMGVTPLMAAAGMGVSVRDPRGQYGSDVEARAIDTLRVLIDAGADVNARSTDTRSRTARIARPSTMTDRQGQTALYGAINWGWTDVVKFLLAQGARVDVADDRGRTPQDAAAGNAGGRDFRKVDAIIALVGARPVDR